MHKYKISIIGSFGFGKNLRDGQTIKTIELSKQFIKKLGEREIHCVDTHDWIKKPWSLLGKVIYACRNSENVIMLPAHNALKIIPRLSLLSRSKNVKLFYSVIGGWLPDFLKNRPKLSKALKSLDGIWVETKAMKNNLEKEGFNNITVIPNFKDLKIIKPLDLKEFKENPLRLSIFSRVQKQKGVSLAIKAIKNVNLRKNKIIYSLDIYGPIDHEYKDEFSQLCSENSSFVKYGGIVAPDKSVDILQNYFALLFPTMYETEGIPGTIIDAFAAGLPVIAARWNNFKEIIIEEKTGLGFELGNLQNLENLLEDISHNPQKINSMKKNVVSEAQLYMPEEILKRMFNLMSL